jgi:hypothetical protein
MNFAYNTANIPQGGGSVDSITKLLLSLDGNMTDISPTPKSVQAMGNTKIDSSQYKYGQGSAQFDGSGDYLSIPDSPDWDFGTQDFTVDFWVRYPSAPGVHYLLSRNNDTDFSFYYNGSTLAFWAGYASRISFSWSPSANTWYHIALVRASGKLQFYLNGVKQGSDQTYTANMIGQSPLIIGGRSVGDIFLNGWLDDIRISQGVARYTANFTPTAINQGPSYHAHILLDGGAVIEENPLDGTLSLTGLSQGSHTLDAYLADQSETKVQGSDSAQVNFTVTLPTNQ